MKCIKCGYETNENAKFCQHCGFALPTSLSPLEERTLLLFSSPLFLALCILCTVSAALSLINGGIPVIRTLFCIFLWLLFSQKGKGIVNTAYMRCISGTIFASYIINLILCCIAFLGGVLLIILFSTASLTNLWDKIFSGISPYLGSYKESLFSSTAFFSLLLSAGIIAFAIIGILLNMYGKRTIHRFAQSLYQNIGNGQMNLANCSAAQTWLMVFGVLDGVSAIFNLATGGFDSFLATGCLSAASIIGSILINEYFSTLCPEKFQGF